MKRAIFALLVLLAACLFAGDTVRPGLEGIEMRMPGLEEKQLLMAIKQPFLEGMDVTDALQDWFDGRLLDTKGRTDEAKKLWTAGLGKLGGLKELGPVNWGPMPDGTFTFLKQLSLRRHPNVQVELVSWKVDGLLEYGIVLSPLKKAEGAKYPLLLYCHGAAYGLPVDFMNFLAELVEQGYVVAGPSMRGEPVFQNDFLKEEGFDKCDGEIENLDGEVNDCLSMLAAAWKLPYVRPDEFGMVGHSFGAGVGLLTAARVGAKAKAVVSYDAWLVNPQRYYWDRMRRAPRNWDSWEDYCNQPVRPQLEGLKKRSIILNAGMLECPLLLFIGGGYSGSVFHQSHEDFCAVLKALHKDYRYEIMPGGGHNFVLYRNGAQARRAWGIQQKFLEEHYPPLRMENAK